MPWVRRFAALALLLFPAAGGAWAATVKEDVGYAKLAAELGAALPTGAGVHVAMAEANTDPNLTGGIPTDGGYDYIPVASNPQFAGKLFHNLSASSAKADNSAHATLVADYFYGLDDSLAPGIVNVDLYFADTWQGVDYLHGGELKTPEYTGARVFNHSWVDQTNAAALARLDYTAYHYGVLHVAGVNNVNNGGPQPLLASSYNAITVGLTSGAHESGNAAPNPSPGLGLYSGNAFTRTRPDLVAPRSFTSYATPLVSSAAALLVDFGHSHAELSHGSQVLAEDPSYTIQNAETTEVVRSALMAGANRGVWSDYRSAMFSGANGLDSRFGAGQLDVYQSYHILAGGEHERRESGDLADIGNYGFDYQSTFAAIDSSTYDFSVGADSLENLAVSLVWNAHVDIDVSGAAASYAASLADFNLALYRVSDAGRTLVQASLSTQDNTENLWLSNLSPGNYELEVVRTDGLGDWAYGLSWRRSAVGLSADFDGDGLVGLSDFGILKDHFGLAGGRTAGDADGNGRIDLSDFGILKSNFGKTFEPTPTSPSAPQAAVPEPSTWLLACLGGAGALLALRRGRR
ncbi:MAG: PEP-CTERM sorting domain-containing protein [Pirellulales bacterium]